MPRRPEGSVDVCAPNVLIAFNSQLLYCLGHHNYIFRGNPNPIDLSVLLTGSRHSLML